MTKINIFVRLILIKLRRIYEFVNCILQQAGGGDYSFLIMMVAIFAIMYFFMIRPQNKKQKEIANFRKNLEVGQSVITAGGIYGKIKEIEDNAVIVEIASGVKSR